MSVLADNPILGGAVIHTIDAEAITIPASGVITRDFSDPREIRIADGETVNGIILLEDGEPIDPLETERVSLLISSLGSAVAIHQDENTPVAQRLTSTTGLDPVISILPLQLMYAHDGVVWRWWIIS